ncbi:MAG: hypothetical protein LQ343_007264 [Gyalolechia ehrenbergii]|nr:MAG: hypothetical protein LQ343_007264 [Gyalolechia ehrenbergii]
MSFSRVLVTILEMDLPYEHVLIDIAKGDQKTEAYKKLQPFGKVPALDDDGFVIFESRAIYGARVSQAGADLDEVFAYYDKVLAQQTYLAGDEITLVDLFHLPNGAALKAHGYKETFEKYPNVDKWFMGLQGREAWVKAAALAGTAV